MNPLEQLLTAARGHQDLPMQATMAPDSGMPMMGDQAGPPPPLAGGAGPSLAESPGTPPTPSGGGSDREIASTAAQQLSAAIDQANDPALKSAFSAALAAIHKYIVMDEKEHHAALAGKLSPRMMARAHGLQ